MTTGAKEVVEGQEVKDEYGDAFEEATREKTAEELKAEAQETERAEKEEARTTEGAQPEGQTSEEEGKAEATAAASSNEEPDYRKLYEEEHQRYSSLQGMYNNAQGEIEQLKKTASPAKEDLKEEKKDEISAEELLNILDLHEDEDVKAFVDEYDYLAKPLQKIVAKATQLSRQQSNSNAPSPDQIADQVFNLIQRNVHESTIKSSHPDFEALRDNGELKKFVDGLPDGDDKARFQGYYDNGTAEEVIALIDSYKESKGQKSPQAEKEATKEEKASKITNLTAVKSKSRPIDVSKKTGKAESFEDAFDEAIGAKR